MQILVRTSKLFNIFVHTVLLGKNHCEQCCQTRSTLCTFQHPSTVTNTSLIHFSHSTPLPTLYGHLHQTFTPNRSPLRLSKTATDNSHTTFHPRLTACMKTSFPTFPSTTCYHPTRYCVLRHAYYFICLCAALHWLFIKWEIVTEMAVWILTLDFHGYFYFFYFRICDFYWMMCNVSRAKYCKEWMKMNG